MTATTGRATATSGRTGRALPARLLPLALLVVSASACYVYQPVAAAPVPGTTVSFNLTDAGRLAMGQAIGEGAQTLEGEVASVTDSSVVLNMRSVTYINGQVNQWTGERLEVGRRYTANVREKRFSRGRSFALAAGTAGGVIAFIVSRGLLGRGSESDKPGGGGNPTEQ